MDPVHLFKLGFDRLSWLSTRQSAIAGNVANANSPGYAAREIEPFDQEMKRFHLRLTATQPRHMDIRGAEVAQGIAKEADPWAVSASGNSVSLEQEMLKQVNVAADQSLATATVRSFHKMMLLAART
ncbi:flagellar basal body rod protein FlgB [Chthonobacter rhizosphaerae]|uniref:flagellar basal body rod protein FlgB n=1 Tax=Chthonobacter rhizosphaerae TaxID=2735553 RepID=UPI0015EF5D93|nr:flagellar basal body rod protein FlgB [Chthonobacter rhizosphaerae]